MGHTLNAPREFGDLDQEEIAVFCTKGNEMSGNIIRNQSRISAWRGYGRGMVGMGV